MAIKIVGILLTPVPIDKAFAEAGARLKRRPFGASRECQLNDQLCRSGGRIPIWQRISRGRMEKQLPAGSLLLAGLPATGKSSFGNWLEENKGYFHLDFDEEDIIQGRGFGQAQDRLWHHEDATPLWDGILARHQPIVLTWGFAPQFLPLVKQLLTWGFVPAWFTASRAASRGAVIKRGGIDVKYFDRYIELLQPIEAEVAVVFGRNVLQTLHDDGSRPSFDAIYEQVSSWFV